MAKISGRQSLLRKLKEMLQAIRDQIRPALEAGANDIVTLQKRLVPSKTGKLKASIGWVYGDAPKGVGLSSSKAAKALSADSDVKITIFAGDSDAFYARFVEFGTSPGTAGERVGGDATDGERKGRKVKRTHPGTKAQPFFYPAYRAQKKKVRSRIAKATKAAMTKVSSRKGVD